MPRIVVRYFDADPQGRWSRMVRVLASTVRQQVPAWALDLQALPPSPLYSPRGVQRDVHNTRKLDAWADVVEAARDGESLLLLDADTVILRPLDVAWDEPFDVAYTTKPKGSRFPFNGGVVFLRVSDRTRAFVRLWGDANRVFLEQPREHDVWRPAHGGINQSALGMLLSSNQHAKPARFREATTDLVVRRLPCLEWNCEDEHWDQFNPDVTRILHVKGALHRAVFDGVGDPVLRPLVAVWRDLEEAARQDPAPQRRERVIDPADLSNTMVTPSDLVMPSLPPLSRRERRRKAAAGTGATP
jgi:hypothetical protein